MKNKYLSNIKNVRFYFELAEVNLIFTTKIHKIFKKIRIRSKVELIAQLYKLYCYYKFSRKISKIKYTKINCNV